MIFSLLKTNNYSYSRKLTNKFTPNKKQQKIMDIALLQPWRCIFTNIHNATTASMGMEKKKIGQKAQKTSISSEEMEVFHQFRLSRYSVGDIPTIFWKFLYAVERCR